MSLNDMMTVGSTAIALISLLANFLVVRRQSFLQVEALRAAADAELFAWVSEAIDAFADAMSTAKGLGLAWTGSQARERIIHSSSRLSAVADKGRMFFPNLDHAAHPSDGHKPEAFRGWRPLALHALIYAFYMTERLDADAPGPDDAAAKYVFECRRTFINEVQRRLDPKRRHQVLEALSAGGRKETDLAVAERARMKDGLEARHPGAAALPGEVHPERVGTAAE